MRLGFAVCGVVAAAVLLQGCSWNLFGSSEKPAAPEIAAQTTTPAEQPPPKRAAESMALKRFDADADGNVTRNELEQTLTADFKREDANSDAMLDAAEARGLNERLRQEPNMSPVFDWNADGRLVYAEFATQWRTLFDRADRDRDGVVSAEEIVGRPERKPRPPPPIVRPGRDVDGRIAQ